MATIFNSRTLRPKLAHEGYVYNSEGTSVTRGGDMWRCEKRKRSLCKGAARIYGDHVDVYRLHNHAPDYAKTEAAIHKSQLSESMLHEVVPSELAGDGNFSRAMQESVPAQLPNAANSIRTINRRLQVQRRMGMKGAAGPSLLSQAESSDLSLARIEQVVHTYTDNNNQSDGQQESEMIEHKPIQIEYFMNTPDNDNNDANEAMTTPRQSEPTRYLVNAPVNRNNGVNAVATTSRASEQTPYPANTSVNGTTFNNISTMSRQSDQRQQPQKLNHYIPPPTPQPVESQGNPVESEDIFRITLLPEDAEPSKIDAQKRLIQYMINNRYFNQIEFRRK